MSLVVDESSLIQDMSHIIEDLKEENRKLKEEKDQAYFERDRLLAYLSTLVTCSLEKHPEADKDWEHDWRNIVFLNIGPKALSWHIHDSELKLFNHITDTVRFKGKNVWDGHTTEQKYEFLDWFLLDIDSLDTETEG